MAAPGCFIISAVSSNDASGSLIYAQAKEDEGKYHMYGYMQGTSMAAPFVTGTVATWLQACPTLSPEQLKKIVKETARRDDMTGVLPENGDNSWGFGKIDAYEGLKKCIELQASGIESTTRPFDGSVTMEGNRIIIKAASPASHIATDIYSAKGELIRSGVSHAETVSLDTSSLANGIYILKISTGEGVRALKFAK
ncbi:MAG: S8 family serine peptidase [Prevotella sp.]